MYSQTAVRPVSVTGLFIFYQKAMPIRLPMSRRVSDLRVCLFYENDKGDGGRHKDGGEDCLSCTEKQTMKPGNSYVGYF
jgi:hypothetical protein